MKDFNITINPASLFMALLVVILAALVYYLRDLVLIVVTAVVIASAIEPAVHALVRRGVARILAVITMYLSVAIIFFGVLFLFIPPVLSDLAAFLANLPQTLVSLNISDVTHGLLPWGSVADTIYSADLLHTISA